MTPRHLPASAAVITALAAASVAGYVGTHAHDAFSPSTAPAAMLIQHGATVHAAAAATDDTAVTVTTLTQTQFTGSLVGVHTCATSGTVRLCQDIESSRTHLPTWDVYADLGQTMDLRTGSMTVSTTDQRESAGVPGAAGIGPYVKLHWSSSSVDITSGSSTYTKLTLGDTAYEFDCSTTELPDQSWTGVCSISTSPAP